jgi:hypothetical protein
MKTNIKKALTAVKDKDTANVEAVTKAAIAYIDRASSKGVIHKNQAKIRPPEGFPGSPKRPTRFLPNRLDRFLIRQKRKGRVSPALFFFVIQV